MKRKFSFQGYRNRERIKPGYVLRLVVYGLILIGLGIALYEFVKLAR